MEITSFAINVLPMKHQYHRHSEYECHYIIDGEGTLMIGPEGKGASLKKGDFVLIYPGRDHYLESGDTSRSLIQMMWTFQWEDRDRDVSKDVSEHIDSGNIFPVREIMTSYFERMRYLNDTPSRMGKIQARLLLEFFFYSLMGENHVGIHQDRDDAVRLCIKEMYTRIRTDFSVQEFADKAGIAPSQFIRNFKSQYNATPYQYYQEMKISALVTYLRDNPVTLDVAAEKFGFSDRFHLSKVFKKVKKMSPSRYLK